LSLILGIETSCDETGVALVEDGRRVLANQLASQIDVHAAFGGVVPEIASRQHIQCIYQLTDLVLKEAPRPIDAIAATVGPGLMGSLLVGMSFAKSLAFGMKKPFVPVNHLEGHIFSVFLGDNPPEFPFLALLVSGGHTCLIWCEAPHQYKLLGTTRDDAVGESFDKVARLLKLPYPGGPSIQKAAENGDPRAIEFPRSMAKADSLDFSYSGLKTAVLYRMRDHGGKTEDVAASFQHAAIDILVIKTKQAIQKTGAKRLVVAGGVAANALLRKRLVEEAGIPVSLPPLRFCVDNAAMIAAAADSLLAHGHTGGLDTTPNPGLRIEQCQGFSR
jgi:N6-L-threonylcarbamoyladenine synthase